MAGKKIRASPALGIGFTPDTIALFRVLCVAYGLDSIGNALVLLLPYISHHRDGMVASTVLFVVNAQGTAVTLRMPTHYYGFGFLLTGLCLFITAWIQLADSINHLRYDIFCRQSLSTMPRNGPLSRLVRRLDP